ncbi:NAD(P)H-dependent oxidoreductase [Ligilactobacillus equi]|uniref:NADPH-dependent FMN reductase n=1 Tax=Ligilactobacillus equi TaxID=137357 RepID=UPI002ED1BD4E
MKFVAIVGTNADFSLNRNLLRFMQKHFTKQADIEILEIKDLEAFHDASQTPSAQVIAFSDKIHDADGVIISTPEYDHTIPAPLASALEWLGQTKALNHKKVMITGASYGVLGTLRAQEHLRRILQSPNLAANTLAGEEFFLRRAAQAFDEEGNLKDAQVVAQLDQYFADFVSWVKD